MSPVISKRMAKALLAYATGKSDTLNVGALRAELESVFAKSRRLSEKKRPTLKAKKERRATKTQRARSLRTELTERSDASCELCDFPWCGGHRRFDVHHALGRKGLVDGPENTLFLCEFCHEIVTNPGDDAPGWFLRQALVFRRLGHVETAVGLERKAAWAERKIAARSEMTRRAAP